MLWFDLPMQNEPTGITSGRWEVIDILKVTADSM